MPRTTAVKVFMSDKQPESLMLSVRVQNPYKFSELFLGLNQALANINLGRLHASTRLQGMNLPGLGLHELSGDRQVNWAVKVSGNWRDTFPFVGKDADAVVSEDFHRGEKCRCIILPIQEKS
jgi:plasmid maintenance system killer protein